MPHMPHDDLASAKALLKRTAPLAPQPSAGQAMSVDPAAPLGSRKPKRKQRTGDIRLYAPGERDQPLSTQENIRLRNRLQSRRGNGKRGASRRA